MPSLHPSTIEPAHHSATSLLLRSLVLCAGLAFLSACSTVSIDDLAPTTTITPKLAREIKSKGFRDHDPILVRIFKAESELEIWKKKPSGQYALFKTYPICRWSGKLGPKKKTGDRQAPEGFYSVSLGQLNPKSQFYLSFNLGYPNRLESALGYSGEALMVHGACSSSGCFAMTDQGAAEIFALAQKSLQSGQSEFQVQAFPFRMTQKNMSLYKSDSNMAFWRDLKIGYDSFEGSKREPRVSMCSGRYRFNTTYPGAEPTDPLASCPGDVDATMTTAGITPLDDYKPVPLLAYSDGGMHKSFRSMLRMYGPKKLAAKISKRKYPISRPEAALADPY